MHPLAFDKQGKPFEFDSRTELLLARMFRNPGARGTCSVVRDGAGDPLFVDARADFLEFCREVRYVPGLYRLDQCDADGVEIEGAPPAYVSIDSTRNAASFGGASGGEVNPLAIIERLVAIQADVMKTMAAQQASLLSASAEIMRAPYRPAQAATPDKDRDDKEDDADDECAHCAHVESDDDRDDAPEDPWAALRPVIRLLQPELPRIGAFLYEQIIALKNRSKTQAPAAPAAPSPAAASAPSPAPAPAAPAAPSAAAQPAGVAAGSSSSPSATHEAPAAHVASAQAATTTTAAAATAATTVVETPPAVASTIVQAAPAAAHTVATTYAASDASEVRTAASHEAHEPLSDERRDATEELLDEPSADLIDRDASIASVPSSAATSGALARPTISTRMTAPDRAPTDARMTTAARAASSSHPSATPGTSATPAVATTRATAPRTFSPPTTPPTSAAVAAAPSSAAASTSAAVPAPSPTAAPSASTALVTTPAATPPPRNARPEPTPEQVRHLLAIREQLSAKERAIAENAISRMTPDVLADWLAELSALTVDEATQMLRQMIARIRAPRAGGGG